MTSQQNIRNVQISYYLNRAEHGKITHQIVYWPETYPAPDNRQQWVDPLINQD